MKKILLIINYPNIIHAKKIKDQFKDFAVDICALKNTTPPSNLSKYDALIIDSSLNAMQKNTIITNANFVASVRCFSKSSKILMINEIAKFSGTIVKESGIQKGIDAITHSDIEIEKIARIAYELSTDKSLLNIDNAGVLYSSNLWRKIINEINEDYINVYREDINVEDINYYISRESECNLLVEALNENLVIKSLLFNNYKLLSHYLCGESSLKGHIISFSHLDENLLNLEL